MINTARVRTGKRSRRWGRVVAVAAAACVCGLASMGPLAGQASATHFRGGNLNWQKVSGAPPGSQRITVQYEQSWAWDAFGRPAQGSIINPPFGTIETCIDWGDGSSLECLDAIVEFVNAAENYMRIQALAPGSTTDVNVPHDYADPNGTFQIRSTRCCTINELNNAAFATWNILSTVNLAGDDESAVSTIPAIVTLPPGGVQQFTVPAGDPGGETLFFRLSDANESCAGCADPHPPGISIDSSTGVVTIDTTGLDRGLGLNWTGVVIESRNAANEVVATTHIQYIIRVPTGANQPPNWDSPPTPADGTVFTVSPGGTVSFTLQATDPDAGDTVSILQNSGPGTFTPTNGNPATGSFSFTATAADLGNDFIVQFIAQDQDGAGPPFRSYTIRVRSGVNQADLSLTKSDSGDPVTDQLDLTYTLAVTNNGPNDATGVTITDNLPGNVTFVSASAGCAEAGGTVTCNVGNLAAGASAQREIVVRPQQLGTITNTASVSGNESDPIAGNDSDTESTQVEPEPIPEPEPIVEPPVPQAADCSNAIFGDSKGNSLQGTAGPDLLKGLLGNDNLDGLGGNDCVRGGPGSDTVNGGDGDDQLNGGQKPDKVGGGAGDDRIKVQAGQADVVNCGSGNDTVFAGKNDLIHKSCEKVN